MHLLFTTVTGQFANKPILGQSSRGLVNSQTSQLSEDYCIKHFQQFTDLGLVLGLGYINSVVFLWYKKNCSQQNA